MDDFFRTQYSQKDLQQRVAERRGRNGLTIPAGQHARPQSQGDMMTMSGMMGGETLDDIILANDKEMQRRQSYPHEFSDQDLARRSAMLEFGSSNQGLNAYQFGEAAPGDVNASLRRQSSGELDLDGAYAGMGQTMNMSGQQMPYSTSMQGSNPLYINAPSTFQGMPTNMMQSMMQPPTRMGSIAEEDHNSYHMFSQPYSQTYDGNNMGLMSNDFMLPSNGDNSISALGTLNHSQGNGNGTVMGLEGDGAVSNSPHLMDAHQSLSSYNSPTMPNLPPSISNPNLPGIMTPPHITTPPQVVPTQEQDPERVPKPEPKRMYEGIYSSSGFDMLGALLKVATRKDPEIDIGKVDMSCAFVVCDITLYDCPIIYVSDIFERLTGYNKHEVKGQNCRFLQSPEGKIEAGTRREFVDNDSVYYLKDRITGTKEAQRSLINYRKGGQPFMNLLTMIPITGEDNQTIKYYVGFQVDLVEKPTSVGGKSASGSYTVDYSQGMLPRYVWQAPVRQSEGGQTISRDDVSTVLSAKNSGNESDITKGLWDKVLLENTDDVVHVLSLKGLFLYLSPSSRHVLEYDAAELVGTALSSVCHPSDIVPVTRELKDTPVGSAVNIVFRIRRKKSGYTWFESHGTLCVEQGKGRKCIILVGRERPVYALHRHDIEAVGGIGDCEVWTKLSTSGMFLFVSSNVRNLLDRTPEELVGTSIQGLMRAESKVGFDRSLEKARAGVRVTHKHEVSNRKGLVFKAETTLYPGDASEGQKPTFLVGQTRLFKTSVRPVASASTQSSTSVPSVARSDQLLEQSTPASQSSQPAMSHDSLARRSSSGPVTQAGSASLAIGTQDAALASENNIFDELKTTRSTSWQFELRQMEKSNRMLAEELASLLANKKKRKRRRAGYLQRDCANCHTRVTPEWRRGPSGQRDLCNSCGLRWAKQTGRVSSRVSSRGDRQSQCSASPQHYSPLQQEMFLSQVADVPSPTPKERNSQTSG